MASHEMVTSTALTATLPTRGASGCCSTVTDTGLMSKRFGEPLSVTRTVMMCELDAWACTGVQVKTPFVELIVAPCGTGGSRLNVRTWRGMSESVAETVKVNKLPAGMVCALMASMTGGRLVASDRGFAGSEPNSISVRSK